MAKQQEEFQMMDPQVLRSLTGLNGHFAEGVSRSTEVFARSVESLPMEMLRFTARRMRNDADTIRACAHCETLGDFMDRQRAWLERASQDYLDESSKFMQMAQAMFQEIASTPVQTGESKQRQQKSGGSSAPTASE